MGCVGSVRKRCWEEKQRSIMFLGGRPATSLVHAECLQDAIEDYRTEVLHFCPNGCGRFKIKDHFDGMGSRGSCDKCGFQWKTS